MTAAEYREKLTEIVAFVRSRRVGGAAAVRLWSRYWRLAMDGDRDFPGAVEVLPLDYDKTGYLRLGRPREPAKILVWRPGPTGKRNTVYQGDEPPRNAAYSNCGTLARTSGAQCASPPWPEHVPRAVIELHNPSLHCVTHAPPV